MALGLLADWRAVHAGGIVAQDLGKPCLWARKCLQEVQHTEATIICSLRELPRNLASERGTSPPLASRIPSEARYGQLHVQADIAHQEAAGETM